MNPKTAAQQCIDAHVVKMIVELAQLLSTAHRMLDGKESEVEYLQTNKKTGISKLRKKKVWALQDSRNKVLYKASHMKHPSGIWIRASNANYLWAYQHFLELCKEYTHRYGKTHSTFNKLGVELGRVPDKIKYDNVLTKPPCCMPEECKISDDPVVNYREYYMKHKQLNKAGRNIFKWTKREKPEWAKL